jgi:hypothetical protein
MSTKDGTTVTCLVAGIGSASFGEKAEARSEQL